MTDAETLRALMEADRWIDRVAAQRTHLPESAELSELEAELRRLVASLREAEADLAPTKLAYDAAADESRRLKQRAGDLDATLSSSTAHARELTALEHEFTHVRQLLGESEDRELALLMDLEPKEAAVASIRAAAQPGVARRARLTETIEQLRATLDEELVALRDGRLERARDVSATLLARYDVALARVGASGAAQVVEGRCDGCRLALSPLDLDRFKALDATTFMDCPECGRILLS